MIDPSANTSGPNHALDLLLRDLDEEVEAEGFVCVYLIGWSAKGLFPDMPAGDLRDITEAAYRALKTRRDMRVVEMPWPTHLDSAVDVREPESIDFAHKTSEELEVPLLALALR